MFKNCIGFLCLRSTRKTLLILITEEEELYFGIKLFIFCTVVPNARLLCDIVCREPCNQRAACGLEERPWSTILTHFPSGCRKHQYRQPKTPSEKRLLRTPKSRVACMFNKLSRLALYLDRSTTRFLTHFFCSTGPPQVSNPNTHHFFNQPTLYLDRSTARFLTHFFARQARPKLATRIPAIFSSTRILS